MLHCREMAEGGMEGMYRGMAAEMTRAMLFQALLMATKEQRMESLKEFIPGADNSDWTVITAAQRVQIMKADPKKIGILQFGTEVKLVSRW